MIANTLPYSGLLWLLIAWLAIVAIALAYNLIKGNRDERDYQSSLAACSSDTGGLNSAVQGTDGDSVPAGDAGLLGKTSRRWW